MDNKTIFEIKDEIIRMVKNDKQSYFSYFKDYSYGDNINITVTFFIHKELDKGNKYISLVCYNTLKQNNLVFLDNIDCNSEEDIEKNIAKSFNKCASSLKKIAAELYSFCEVFNN